jgi:hypothetical protein
VEEEKGELIKMRRMRKRIGSRDKGRGKKELV